MCSLFGLIDYKHKLTAKQKNKLITVLSRECEVRGTDATGIAYNSGGKLEIHKKPLAAHRLKFRIPQDVTTIMGHTRMTTQGHASFNENNHPFFGKLADSAFALAHNGVLWNDEWLRRQEKLPKTAIETDSYVAVQLIEKENTLDFNSLKNMAEKTEGTFVFTVLDEANAIWFIRGDNPLCLMDFGGFLIYASTKEILTKTRKKLRLGKPKTITEPKEGDILRIDENGEWTSATFAAQQSVGSWYYAGWADRMFGIDDAESDYLIDIAKCMGISETEVQMLKDFGCSAEEIEELLYNPSLLRGLTEELVYAY